MGKARTGTTPVALAHCLDITALFVWRVVVNNGLMALPVTLSRREYDGSGILQHRDEQWDDEGL